jgi:hypothetical protein
MGAAKLFADDQVATLILFQAFQALIAANVVLFWLLQGSLIVSLYRFRARVREARKVLELPFDTVWRKVAGDAVFLLYFFIAPTIAAIIALIYICMRWIQLDPSFAPIVWPILV